MINISTLQQNTPTYAPKIEQKTDKSFDSFLSDAVNEKSETDQTAVEKALIRMKRESGTYDPHDKTPVEIPDKWVTEDGKSAEKIVRSFLEEQGIDFEETIPTHELTEEQKEWLRSRHDFENMKLGLFNEECENFYADLMVLGVCSYRDIQKLFLTQIPMDGGGVLMKVPPVDMSSFGLNIGTGLRSLKHVYQTTFDMQNSILTAIINNAGSPSALSAEDKKFVDTATEFLSQKQMIYELLLGLFE